MNKKEQSSIEIIATDVKWIVKSLNSMNSHLRELNNNVAKNTLNIAVNSTSITGNRRMTNRQWGVIGAVISTLITLKVMGVY